MKTLFALLVTASLMSFTVWQPNFQVAKQVAHDKHRLILLNFSGSDWCAPCMRMKSEYFESKVFSQMADSDLVMLNADFPRSKKHKLSDLQQRENDKLADKYNPEGKFPLTILLDENGKIVKSWDGLPEASPEQFTQQIKEISDKNK